MKKRLIALTILLCMLVSVSPTVAAEDTVPRPTVEEILNEYHEKAFEAETAEKSDSTSAYSRGVDNSGKTLEEETVDTLNAAGYEAYNVTSENYETLEEQLQTDFAQMGMDPDGSYIIAISGEDNSPGNNARIPTPEVTPTLPPEVGNPSYFSYTYQGTTYFMRYVTVTATEESSLGKSTTIDLLQKYDANSFAALNLPITIASSLGLLPYTGTVYSLFSAIVPNINNARPTEINYIGGTNWTVTYTQIYNFQEETWVLSGSVEYVTLRYSISCSYYDPATNQYEFAHSEGATYDVVYSSLYNDKVAMKERAAYAYENNAWWGDKVEYVQYKFAGKTVITHTRRQEYLGYEPA